MDRNIVLPKELYRTPPVALRKESVDRNLVGCIDRTIDIVALRKESVDRNSATRIYKKVKNTSLSARRAWIEIPALLSNNQNAGVALRKESVDRNHTEGLLP